MVAALERRLLGEERCIGLRRELGDNSSAIREYTPLATCDMGVLHHSSRFYSTALPVWEGFDEWSHFAVIQRMALRGDFLPWRYSPYQEILRPP